MNVKTMIIAGILCNVLFWGGIVYLGVAAVDYLSNNGGIKEVAGPIWDGEK